MCVCVCERERSRLVAVAAAAAAAVVGVAVVEREIKYHILNILNCTEFSNTSLDWWSSSHHCSCSSERTLMLLGVDGDYDDEENL